MPDQFCTTIDIDKAADGPELPQQTLSAAAMDREKNIDCLRSERSFSPNGTTRLEGSRLCLKSGIHFYPSSSSNAVTWVGEIKDENHDAHHDTRNYRLEQSHFLDPTAIFKTDTAAETNKMAPEQKITVFALRLAMIEKAASGIGTLSFIWASTIILGGFASNINPVDFIVITLILVTEGTRIFSRSRELEWQHLASKSTDNSRTYRKLRRLKLSGKQYNERDRSKKYGGSLSCMGTRKEPTPSELSAPEVPESTIKVAYKSVKAISQKNLQESDVGYGDKKLQPIQRSASIQIMSIDKPAGVKRTVSVEIDAIDRTWSSESLVPMCPGGCSSILSTRGVSAILFWVQMTSAIICLVLSCWRLRHQEFNPPAVAKSDTPVNLYTSLNIFYTLALIEALLFLLERVYWAYKINYEQLMVQVNNKAALGQENQEMMKQFFYEVYKKCIDGSVFDGLDMDIVEYSLALLQSDNSYEQLGGLRVLRKIVDRYDGFSEDVLRRVGTASGVIERLLEMLSWRSSHQEEIRLEVAALICRVVRYSKNCFRIAAVPGSMEGIVSLLKPLNEGSTRLNKAVERLRSVRAIALRLDGLRILVAQARDPINLLKIGETRGLVPILVSVIAVKDVSTFKRMEGTELKTFKKVLRLLAMLAAARNRSGIILRPMIARVVSGIASMRDILQFGECHPKLQWMAIEILTNLALDDDIRIAIGSTGGVIRYLFTLYVRNLDRPAGALDFTTEENRKVEKAVSNKAGDGLNLLAIMNRRNCLRMMELQDEDGKKSFIPALISLLNENREQTICAAKILRSLMEYGSDVQKREIATCVPRLMSLVMESSSQKMQEAVVGLAPRVLAVLDEQIYNQVFANVDRRELVRKLLRNLDYNSQTSSRYPRIRRHSVEFILALVSKDANFLEEFMKEGFLENQLVQTLDSICEAENFVIFSGAEGLTRHSTTMEDLVQRTLHEIRILVQRPEKKKNRNVLTHSHSN